MEKQQELIQNSSTTLGMHPKKFALWLFIVSIIMIFAALTSAYIVRQAEGNWYTFDIPTVFYVSTVVILASSLTMHLSVLEARKDNLGNVKALLLVSSALGAAFLGLQFYGWVELVNINVYFVGNPSGSFIYVLTGLHGFHLISGIIFLFIVLWMSFRYRVHSKNILWLEMGATYWHFLDFLWIYLFVFMLVNR